MRRLPKQLRMLLVIIAVCCGCERLGIRLGKQPLPSPIRVDQGVAPSDEPTPSNPPSVELATQGSRKTDAAEVISPYTQWTFAETSADALGRMRHEAVPALIEALNDPSPIVRGRAIRIIARIGPDAAEAVPALIERLRDDDETVRIAAARALGQIGPGAKAAIPVLMQGLREEN